MTPLILSYKTLQKFNLSFIKKIRFFYLYILKTERKVKAILKIFYKIAKNSKFAPFYELIYLFSLI